MPKRPTTGPQDVTYRRRIVFFWVIDDDHLKSAAGKCLPLEGSQRSREHVVPPVGGYDHAQLHHAR